MERWHCSCGRSLPAGTEDEQLEHCRNTGPAFNRFFSGHKEDRCNCVIAVLRSVLTQSSQAECDQLLEKYVYPSHVTTFFNDFYVTHDRPAQNSL